jgi:hypothetical protein
VLAPNIVTDFLTSAHCYCRGTWHRHVDTNLHNNDGMPDINDPLLLAAIVVMCLLTL